MYTSSGSAATHRNTPQHTATHRKTPQHTARHRNALQQTTTNPNTPLAHLLALHPHKRSLFVRFLAFSPSQAHAVHKYACYFDAE